MGPSSLLLLLGTGVGKSPCPRHSLWEGTGYSVPGWELGSASAWARIVSTWAGCPGARAQQMIHRSEGCHVPQHLAHETPRMGTSSH